MQRLRLAPVVNFFPDGVYSNGRAFAVMLNVGKRAISLSVDNSAPLEQIIDGVWEAAAEAHRRFAAVVPVTDVD